MSKKTFGILAIAGLFSILRVGASPNILFIIADDFGPEMGAYGDANAVTPHLDKLASEGIRFNNGHVTAASCSPSRGSMFTGLYPHQNGMFGLSQQKWSRMYDDVPILPNELKKRGYSTAIIGKTHFEPEHLFEWDLRITDPQKIVRERDVRWMNRKASEYLDSLDSEKPFFLVMSYVDPHRGGGDGRYEPGRNERFPRIRHGLPDKPLTPEEIEVMPYLAMDSEKLRLEISDYYAAISRLDTGVGEMLSILKDKGFSEDTFVVFIGDHGADVTRGKISAYTTATHIPFLVKWPGVVEAGMVRDELVSTVDLFPTFMEAAGAAEPRVDIRQTGLSLQPLFTDQKTEWRNVLFTEFITHVPWQYYPRYTAITQDFQLIYNVFGGERENPLEGHNYCYAWWEAMKPEYQGTLERTAYDRVENPPQTELFALRKDPALLCNLASEPKYNDVVEQLLDAIQEWRVETKDPFLNPEFGYAFEAEVSKKYEVWKKRHNVKH